MSSGFEDRKLERVLEDVLGGGEVKSDFEAFKDKHSEAMDSLKKSDACRVSLVGWAGRYIMNKSVLRYAAVILILAVLGAGIYVSGKFTSQAYAIEQTIEAFHSIKSIYTRIYYPINSEPASLWVEFNGKGQAERLRASQPAFDPHDGPKEIVWENDIAKVWSKKTNTFYIIKEADNIERIGRLFQNLDPKFLINKLETMRDEGIAKLDIEQPDDVCEPIVITATLTKEDEYLGHKAIILVDQATKLVISLETTKRDGTLAHKNGHFGLEDFNRIEFFDYNQSFDEDIFVINVPDDVMVIDRATKKVGLSMRNMSIGDTSIEVVKQFWEGIISQDYEKAGLMYGGISAEIIERHFGKKPNEEILKVISIGKVKIHPNPMYKNKAFLVPCTIEYKKDGQISQKTINCVVREVDGQPGQWAICGGI